MRSDKTKADLYRSFPFAALALLACALAGCSGTSAERSPGTGRVKAATPAAARAEISRICMKEPEKYFGPGRKTTKAHCDCYGSGVVKQLKKDEVSFVVTYKEIPSLSQDQYDEVLAGCLGGAPSAPEKAAAKN